ncbi:hypothetical protein ONZ51_g9541 [Trametes cubensis]|uniref:Inhibitor I9 domain-containing protein n=1 Tax=Trametes cubensis TaxID=1111947 RepID=A0AAD7TMB1_9APHY|nr:hypothetical protein ONZ51_g9541 [Trametes cubensis]
MSGKYIVVFKDHVSQSEIDKYINEVNANGGNVGQRYDSVLKVSQPIAQRSRARAQHAHEAVIITQGFSAQIPESYLQRLQAFQGSVIDYIGRQSLFSFAWRHPCFDAVPRTHLRGALDLR